MSIFRGLTVPSPQGKNVHTFSPLCTIAITYVAVDSGNARKYRPSGRHRIKGPASFTNIIHVSITCGVENLVVGDADGDFGLESDSGLRTTPAHPQDTHRCQQLPTESLHICKKPQVRSRPSLQLNRFGPVFYHTLQNSMRTAHDWSQFMCQA